MSRSGIRRTTALALATPILTAALLAGAAPAGAVPSEGDPGPTRCLHLEAYAGAGERGSTLFVSHGWVAVLVSGAGCSPAVT